jgi:hypothetical protein
MGSGCCGGSSKDSKTQPVKTGQAAEAATKAQPAAPQQKKSGGCCGA